MGDSANQQPRPQLSRASSESSYLNLNNINPFASSQPVAVASTSNGPFVAKGTAMGVLAFKNTTENGITTTQLVTRVFPDGPNSKVEITKDEFKDKTPLSLDDKETQKNVSYAIASMINEQALACKGGPDTCGADLSDSSQGNLNRTNIGEIIKENNATGLPNSNLGVIKGGDCGQTHPLPATGGEPPLDTPPSENFQSGGTGELPVAPSNGSNPSMIRGGRKSAKRLRFKRAKSSKMRGGRRRTPRHFRR